MTKGTQSSSNRWLLSAWEYAGELVLAVLVSVLLFVAAQQGVLQSQLCRLRNDLMLIVGIALGISATVWVGFLALLSSEFGVWLRKKNEAFSYSRALAVPLFGDLVGILLLLLAACSESLWLVKMNVFILIYDLINFVTLIRNVNGLVRLWQTWEQQRRS